MAKPGSSGQAGAEIENASDNSEPSCCAVRHSPLLIDVPLRIGGLVSGQTRLVTELYSQGQANLVLAQLSLVQPVNFSMALSKSLEVAPPARKSTYNSFNSHYKSARHRLLFYIALSLFVTVLLRPSSFIHQTISAV